MVEKIIIDINYKDYQKLAYQRKNALEKHILIANPDDYVSSIITYNNKKLRSKIRLKGDWMDHLKSDMWSYRVKITGNQTLFGMKKFSIQKPSVRHQPYDFTFQSLVRDTGGIAPFHKFAHIIVNGVDWGVMDIEEHMSKELLEKQNRKESIIVSFFNDSKWIYLQKSKLPYSGYRPSDPFIFLNL